jgi:hypothetical protein
MTTYTYHDLPNVSATINADTYAMTITVDGETVTFDDGHAYKPCRRQTDAQSCATLLAFYSAYAEQGPDSIDSEGLPYSPEQWEALEMVGSDGFYMWSEEIAPTCTEGCGAYVQTPGARCAYHTS